MELHDRARRSIPYLLFAVALLLALWFAATKDESLRRMLAGVFAVLLGASTVLWGAEALHTGQVRVKRRYASRQDNPWTFWSVVLFFRFFLGGVLLLGGLWHLLKQK